MQWNIQAGKITTNLKVNIEFSLPEVSVTKNATWNFHDDDSIKIRYDMILRRDILTSLRLNIKFSDHVIKADDGLLKGYTSPMIYMGTCEFKSLHRGEDTPE